MTNIDIDYIVPMVFPDDPKWRHDLLTATGTYHDDRSAVTNVRYRSWNTEPILIDLIRKNLPWLRTIHIILARPSQLQPWMKPLLSSSPLSIVGDSIAAPIAEASANGHSASSASSGLPARTPAVRVVYHRDFIPSRHLPTFNSRTIEMFLHRIPGLAPCFLYANDDMFPISPLPATAFFRPATVPAASPAVTAPATSPAVTVPAASPAVQTVPAASPAVTTPATTPCALLPCLHATPKPCAPNNAFHRACLNGLNFVAATVAEASANGPTPSSVSSGFPARKPSPSRFTANWLHLGHNILPVLKSTCEMFWHRYPDRLTASITPFRLPHNFNQYIYPWYHILTGQYIDYRPPSSYVSTKDAPDTILAAIRNATGLLCINDNEAVADITNLAASVRTELRHRL